MSDKNEPSSGNTPDPKEAEAGKGGQPVADIIEAFGGLRPMAGKLKVAVSTVQGWKERDSIPTARHGEILAAAKTHNITLDPAVLAASDHMMRGQAGKTTPGETMSSETATGSKDQTVKTQDPGAKSGPTAKPAASGAAAQAASGGQESGGAPKSAIPASGSSKDSAPGLGAPGSKTSAASKAPESKVPETKGPEKTAAASAPKAKSSGWFGGFVLGVILLALVLGGAVYSRGHWLPLVESLPMMAGGAATGSQDEEAAQTAARIEALESKLAALETQVQSAGGAVDLSAVDQAITDANQRIDSLDGTLEQLLAGGVVIASNGASDTASSESESGGAAGSVLDAGELDALKTRLDDLAGKIESAPAASAPQADAGRLAELSARLDEMEQKVTGIEDPSARLSELDSRLSAAEQTVAAVPALESRVTSELAALQQAIPTGPSEDAGDAAMFLALLQLREALSSSGSFETELALVNQLAAEDAELKTALTPLDGRAAAGIPALTSLQASFDDMAAQVVAASRGGEEGDWIGKTLQKVSEVVTIRPVGLVEGDDAGAVLARAEVKLDAGDLAAAVAELDGLTGAAAEGAASWRSDAEARLEAQKALSLLAARAATLIGLGG